MKIAIYHDLPSGGAKRALYEIARRLSASHTLDLFSLTSSEQEFGDIRPFCRRQELLPFRPGRLLASPLGRLNQLQRWRDLLRLERLGRAAAAQIDAGGYDVAYVHPSMWTQAPAPLAFLRTPSLYQIQEPLRKWYEPPLARPYDNQGLARRLDQVDPLIRLYGRRLVALDRRAVLAATRLVANSRFSAANIERAYGRPAALCYLGVDAERFRPLAGVERGPAVLSVGALRPSKGFDFLVEALGRLEPARRPPLWLVGNASDERERRYLEKLADQRGVSLRLETMVDEPTLIRRYNEAAATLYAPVREPFGFVPLEAMACATPLVGVAEGGVAETIEDGLTGLVAERRPDAFAAAVGRLLADGPLRRRLGAAGRERAQRCWSWEDTVAGIESLLRFDS
jgi:glycosyltransferase involved in cell wall biosynthesis